MPHVEQHCVGEWSYQSSLPYDDPFNEVSLDVLVVNPEGTQQIVPAFWAGGQTWKVRYSSPLVGIHRFRTRCSDTRNTGLHGQEGELVVAPYTGHNPLLSHGSLRVAADRRHLEHADGTPFFWLGDTWWHGLVKRFPWPEGVHALAADRVAKGFTVIQIVAGLLPELTRERYWEHWSANEAGWAWEPGFARIDPAYWDQADLRLQHLVRAGLVPCLVGAWGYYLQDMGVARMKQHWRHLVARYGAYPMIWCVAGEVNMPTYGSPRWDEDMRELSAGWTEVARYLRQIDPYGHVTVAHPGYPDGRNLFTDDSVVDITMLQTAHTYYHMDVTVQKVIEAVAQQPRYPVLIGEVCYEGEYGGNWQDVQRFNFWASLMNGSMGHTYGANSIWQFSTADQPFVGIRTYGDLTWEQAMHLPGSAQMGVGKRLLERYRWWRFEPMPVPGWDASRRLSPFAAGIPGQVWVLYLGGECFDPKYGGLRDQAIALEPGVAYRGYWYNPRDGRERDLGAIPPDASGRWQVPEKPTREDLVLVLEAPGARV